MTDTSTEETASPAPTSLFERMVAAGIGEERARGHVDRGVVRVDGEAATDPATPVPWPTAWLLTAE